MTSLIEILGKHRIAANGMMFLVILFGLWSLQNINRQFFPDFEFNSISITASWENASAEDVQEAITEPLENAILTSSEVESIRSTSSENQMRIRISLTDGTDPTQARQAIEDLVRTVALPQDVDPPEVTVPVRYEPVTDLLLYGQTDLSLLHSTARDIAEQLRRAGIAQINLTGIPDEYFDVVVSSETLLDLDMTLGQIASALKANNQNLPAGIAGSSDQTIQLRAQGKVDDLNSLSDLIVISNPDTGARLRLGDIATITRTTPNDYQYLTYEGMPAVELDLRRLPGQDTLRTADIYRNWMAQAELPEGLSLLPYNERWRFLEARIQLIMENGLLGMGLVLLVLFIFLNTRIAIWVAIGIPVSFMATLVFMDLNGTSINVLSLFGFIIALGIIVDDAIVVSEDTQMLETSGMEPMEAAILAAKRMWPPILASSLTTIAAFTPLLMLGGRLGDFLIDIPTVVICAILASLIECFLILPGHLGHYSKSVGKAESKGLRKRINDGFNRFRDQWFMPVAIKAIDYHWITLALVMALFIIMLGFIRAGMIKVSLPPHVEGTGMSVSVSFAEGSDELIISEFKSELIGALRAVETATDYPFVQTLVINNRTGARENFSINIELTGDVDRPYTNQELVSRWREQVSIPAGVTDISFGRSFRGLSNADVVVRLRGDSIDDLKNASVRLQQLISNYEGVSDARDDLPYGTEQWRFSLTSAATTAGWTLPELAGSLQTQLNGTRIGFIQDDGEDIDIQLRLNERQSGQIMMLESLPMVHNNGEWVPLGTLLNIQVQRGVDSFSRQDGDMSIIVTADVDDNVANVAEINAAIEQQLLPSISQEFGVSPVVEGNRLDEQRVLTDMKMGVIIALLLIFGILAWIFESWLWPFAVIIAVPFGLTGALFGHWVMGLDVSMLSLFGLFGLSGIVINDSIVLISFYKRLRAEGQEPRQAVIQATSLRLRAVLLTSFTTIAGLLPLLFETSYDAQFLIPMAVVMVFGLAFGTILILLLIPGLLLSIDSMIIRAQQRRGNSHGHSTST